MNLLRVFTKKLFLTSFFIMPFFLSLANEPKKILFIDNVHIDEIASWFDRYDDSLSKKGFKVDLATSVEDATLKWLIFQPDIVLLNIQIPIKLKDYSFTDRDGGLKVLLEVLKIDPTNKAKVVLTPNDKIDFLFPEVRGLIDYNLDEKFDSEKHSQLLQEWIDKDEAPKRKSYLPQLEQNTTNDWIQYIRESLKTYQDSLSLSLFSGLTEDEIEYMKQHPRLIKKEKQRWFSSTVEFPCDNTKQTRKFSRS